MQSVWIPSVTSDGKENKKMYCDPLASAAFCVGIHPEVCALDAEIQEAGQGGARFDMDDGYAVGPPDVVFPAVLRFAERLHALGLELQLSKCQCYSVAIDLAVHPDRPPQMPVGGLVLPDGSFTRGVIVSGIPLGDDAFVTAALTDKVEDSLSKVSAISSKLQARHLQSLYAVTTYCLQPLFHFWLQHCYPEQVQTMAARLDTRFLALPDMCIGGGASPRTRLQKKVPPVKTSRGAEGRKGERLAKNVCYSNILGAPQGLSS